MLLREVRQMLFAKRSPEQWFILLLAACAILMVPVLWRLGVHPRNDNVDRTAKVIKALMADEELSPGALNWFLSEKPEAQEVIIGEVAAKLGISPQELKDFLGTLVIKKSDTYPRFRSNHSPTGPKAVGDFF